MNVSIEKRFFSLLLAFLMVCTWLPWSTVEVYADYDDTPIAELDGKVVISGQQNAGQNKITIDTATTGTYKIQLENENDNCANGSSHTITLTATQTIFFSFDYTATNPDSFTVDDVDKISELSGKWKGTLNAGDAVTFVIKNKDGAKTTGSLTLSNFKIESVTKYDVTLIPGEGGTLKYGDGTTDETITETTTKQVANTDEVTLTAAANEGYVFAGWMDENGTFVSGSNLLKFKPDTAVSYQPKFISDAGAYYGVGEYKFDNLKAACKYAEDVSTKTVVLLSDGVLPAGEYIIPAGVTLLIPRDEAHTVNTGEPNRTGSEEYVKPTKAFRTLTLATGASLIVNGTLCVNATQSADQSHAGYVSGAYGCIDMASGSTITMNDGSTLYTWGYIIGSGSVVANSGSTVHENFQLADFRGGNGTSKMADNSQRVFPMSQYYVQNIEVPLTVHTGATLRGNMSLDITLAGIQAADVPIIGPSDAMFTIKSGYIIKDYKEGTGRTEFTIEGDVDVSPIAMKMNLGLAGNVNLDSSKYNLPIPGHMTVIANSGNMNIAQDIVLLPGSELYVGENVTCKIASGKKIIVYDLDEWGTYCRHSNERWIALTYAPGGLGTVGREKDALVQIDGFIDASEGAVYATAGGANVYSTGTGRAVTTPGTDTVTYQVVKQTNTGSGLSASCTIEYATISIKPAVLKNADGTVLDTGLATGTNAYKYENGKWVCDLENETCPGHHTRPADVPCGKGLTCAVCGETFDLEHKDENTDHVCDNGCPTYMGEHADGDDADHLCDYGCGQIADDGCHDATVDGQHICDECHEEIAGACVDSNTDHICDNDSACTAFSTGDNAHVDTDQDHDCEYGCSDPIGEHSDSATDEDHVCDYGCGETLEACTGGEPVIENNVAPDFGVDGSYDTVVYCSVCGEELSRVTTTVPAKIAVATVGETKFESLEEAIAAAGQGDTVVLQLDVTLTEKLVIDTGKQINLDLNEKTLTTFAVDGNYDIVVKGDLTLKNGSIVVSGMLGIGVTGKLTVESGSYSVAGDNDYLIGSWGETIINGGEFVGQYSCVNRFDGNVTITGGKFTTDEYDCTGEYESADVFGDGGVVISGGTFSKAVADEHLAEGYCDKQTDDGYVVAEHAYEAVVTDPTCTEQGYTTHTCSVCGNSYEDTYVDPLQHAWSVSYSWDQDADGNWICTATHICANDENHNETATATVSAEQTLAPTCIAVGETTYTAAFTVEWAETRQQTVADVAMDASNHASDDFVYVVNGAGNEDTHTKKHACCKVEVETVMHTYTDGKCVCDDVEQVTVTWTDSEGNMIAQETVDYGEDASTAETAPEVFGYNSTLDTTVEDVTEDQTVEVVLTPKTFGIVWYVDGEAYQTTTVTYDTNVVTVEAPEKVGYTFLGWYDGDRLITNETVYSQNNITITVPMAEGDDPEIAGTTVLEAKYEIKTYTITWNVDGKVTEETYEHFQMPVFSGSTDKAYDDDYHYDFAGWDADGDGAVDGISEVNGPVTYTAVYTKKAHTDLETDNDHVCEYGCGKILEDHTVVTDAAVAPTCTETGLTEGSHCSVCGETLVKQEVVDALNHPESAWIVIDIVEATCNNMGYTGDTQCDLCKEILEHGKKIPMLPAVAAIDGYKYATLEEAIAAAENGQTVTLLKNRPLTEKLVIEADKQIILDLNGKTLTTHAEDGNYDIVVKGDLTLKNGGIMVSGWYGIGVTGKLTVDDVRISAAGDNDYLIGNWGETVINDGEFTGQYCCVNNFSGTVTINGGTFITENVDATGYYETADVLGDGGVSISGGSFSKDVEDDYLAEGCCVELIDAFYVVDAHAYDADVTDPTCTEDGCTVYTCSRCGDTYTEIIAAPGHTDEEVVVENNVAPDCENAGSYDNVIYCAVCDAELSRETVTVDALGHTEGEAVVENEVDVTCTADGSYDTVVYCSVCDAELSRETTVIPATGHTDGEVVVENEVAPDCENAGSYDNVIYCTICDAELSRETVTVDATGHSYTNYVPARDGHEYASCDNNCGSTDAQLKAGFVAGGQCGDDLWWELTEDGTMYISGNGEMWHYADEYRAWMEFQSGIKKLVVEEGVTTIGSEAFLNCWNLKETSFPDTLETISYRAFENCSALQTVELPESLRTVGQAAFKWTNLSNLVIPEGVVTIEEEAFYELGNLKTLSLPSTLKTIGESAFAWGWINTITFNGNAPAIADNAFEEITATCYYPVKDATWTEDVMQDYGGDLTWIVNCDHSNVVTDEAVEPDCTNTGLTEGSHCDDCGKILVEQETVDAKGHTDGEVVVENNVAPDCENAGSYDNVIYCTVCDAELSRETVTVDALGHTEGEAVVENEVAATCTADGSYDSVVYCSVCDAELSRESVTVPALAHSHSRYGYDEDGHWSVCACGATVEGSASEHAFTDGKCVCGATQIKIVFIDEDTVLPHTVKGQTVTVENDLACRAGYWDEENNQYIAITAVKNEDDSYSFTAPEGVTEVLIVITGDTNGDGKVTAPDIARLNAHLNAKTVLTAKELFAADVNYDGRLDADDKLSMSKAILGIVPLVWEVETVVE